MEQLDLLINIIKIMQKGEILSTCNIVRRVINS